MEFKDRVFKVKPGQKAVSASWLEVLKWLVTFGRKGSTHKVVDIKTPEHVNCRCVSVATFDLSTEKVSNEHQSPEWDNEIGLGRDREIKKTCDEQCSEMEGLISDLYNSTKKTSSNITSVVSKAEVSHGFRVHMCKHCTQMINEHDTTCPYCGEGQ